MGKVGRPSKFTQAIADEICRRIALDESLASICRDKHMPEVQTVYRWKDADPKFCEEYVRARTLQGHTVADTIGDIRKQILNGEVDANVGTAAANLAKWEASRRAARDFGDKLDVTSGGEKLGLSEAMQAAEKRLKGE